MFLVGSIVPANLKPTGFRRSDRAPALRRYRGIPAAAAAGGLETGKNI